MRWIMKRTAYYLFLAVLLSMGRVPTVSIIAEDTGSVTADGSGETEIMPIAEARALPFGTRVTVTGWVTVANEFEGPVYFQDETAGLAAFYPPLHTAVEIGDSLVITGPITEFRPGSIGTPGTFLRQIAAHDGDDDIRFSVHPEGSRVIEPVFVTIADMNAGGYEGQLIGIDGVDIGHSGAFQGNVNYQIRDATGAGELRIDNSTDLVGVDIPEGTIRVVGVVDRFNAVYQLKPRFTDDLDIEWTEHPGDDIPREDTFDVTTWNIEWFGSASNGPSDVSLQLQNVKQVIDSTRADLYALQEISNDAVFFQLIAELEDYRGFIANYTQTQRTAYIYNTTTIDSLQVGLVSYNQSSYDWAGRYPLFFRFNTTINDVSKEIIAINIHAKAGSDLDSYTRRTNASEQLKTYLDTSFPGRNILFIGDYNDDVTVSIYQGQVSPYRNFVDDPAYTVITKSLSERGFTSFRTISMIDHITASGSLAGYYLEGSEKVENPSYIGSYLSTTSDHFPVSARFLFDPLVSVDRNVADLPDAYMLRQNYPNPFNSQTTIRYALPYESDVSITVYTLLGQEVRSLVNTRQAAGEYTVRFDAEGLPSGLYFYRMTATGYPDGNGSVRRLVQTKSMMYVR
jgi:endonuclease/exonuclease/phosphatase family metal-dependent hydrolase